MVKRIDLPVELPCQSGCKSIGKFLHETNYFKEGEGWARYEPATVVAFLAQAKGNIDNNKTYSFVADNILNYKQIFGKNGLDITLVATRNYQRYEQVYTTGTDFSSNGNTTL
jgi:TonB-dependent starch-binding outer membrane protein SusC